MPEDRRDHDTDGRPSGEVYDWYRRGMQLLHDGNPAAAAQILSHAADVEPRSRSIREGLARARFDAGHFAAARDDFARILETSPDDDYAHFGYGLAAWRLGDLEAAHEHLAAATTMRPHDRHYESALRQVAATLRARAAGEDAE